MAVALGPAVAASGRDATATTAQPATAVSTRPAWQHARIAAGAGIPAAPQRRTRERRREHRLGKADRNRLAAREILEQGEDGQRQYRCLDRLWTRESGWDHRNRNPRSGAYGIPQALPAGKMARSGADWRTNPRTQIKWGLGYIKKRYGTPCRAWAHFQAVKWY